MNAEGTKKELLPSSRELSTTMLMLGTIFYVALLTINAIAILNEERFLARSTFYFVPQLLSLTDTYTVGWSSAQPPAVTQSYNQAYGQPYEQGGDGDAGVKSRMINLISAVRTLMRSAYLIASLACHSNFAFTVPLIAVNLVVIVYELLLG